MKKRYCEWCGRTRLAKFIRNWPGGVGCRSEADCEKAIVKAAIVPHAALGKARSRSRQKGSQK